MRRRVGAPFVLSLISAECCPQTPLSPLHNRVNSLTLRSPRTSSTMPQIPTMVANSSRVPIRSLGVGRHFELLRTEEWQKWWGDVSGFIPAKNVHVGVLRLKVIHTALSLLSRFSSGLRFVWRPDLTVTNKHTVQLDSHPSQGNRTHPADRPTTQYSSSTLEARGRRADLTCNFKREMALLFRVYAMAQHAHHLGI